MDFDYWMNIVFLNHSTMITTSSLTFTNKTCHFYRIDLREAEPKPKPLFSRTKINAVHDLKVLNTNTILWIEQSDTFNIYRLIEKNISDNTNQFKEIYSITNKLPLLGLRYYPAYKEFEKTKKAIVRILPLPDGYAVGLSSGNLLYYSHDGELIAKTQLALISDQLGINIYGLKLQWDPYTGKIIAYNAESYAEIDKGYKKKYADALKPFLPDDLVNIIMSYQDLQNEKAPVKLSI